MGTSSRTPEGARGARAARARGGVTLLHGASQPRGLEPSRLLASLGAAAIATLFVTQLVDFRAFDLRYRFLDASYEWSYSHVLATAAFAVGTAVSTVGIARNRSNPTAWRVLACIFVFLTIDNVTRLHEHVPGWPVFYTPLVVALAVAANRVAEETALLVTVRAGLVLLGLSLVVHVVGHEVVHAAGWTAASWQFQCKVALKEGTELAGWLLLVPSLAFLALGPKRSGDREPAPEGDLHSGPILLERPVDRFDHLHDVDSER
jgi:hypothetical protein